MSESVQPAARRRFGRVFALFSPLRDKQVWLDVSRNLTLLTLGAVVCAIGFRCILIPQGFLAGGVAGAAMIVHYLVPSTDVGLINILLNIPLFWLGWRRVSRRFIVYSSYGMIAFSMALDYLDLPSIDVSNPIMAAVLAGLIAGAGGGIILRSAGSAGGMDILAVYLNKRFGFKPGQTGFAAAASVLTLGGVLFGLDAALYSAVFSFVYGKTADQIITGFNQRKAFFVVSDKAEEIAQAVLETKKRGVTFLDGTGAYTGNPKKVILSVVTLTELAQMKALVLGIDPNAFMIINDTLEVIGQGHGKMRIY